ncbi:MAG TPA: hypothetical protein VG897_10090, partial [Terriglobales bacterium]|nr:hypothetical protein [Terriglobales bacterium]
KRSSISNREVKERRVASARSNTTELRSHYRFDYTKARPNRFASRLAQTGAVAVVLDPDVASVFRSSEVVNNFLRSAIEAMPPSEKSKKRAS